MVDASENTPNASGDRRRAAAIVTRKKAPFPATFARPGTSLAACRTAVHREVSKIPAKDHVRSRARTYAPAVPSFRRGLARVARFLENILATHAGKCVASPRFVDRLGRRLPLDSR